MAIDRNELRLGDLVEWDGKVWRINMMYNEVCLLAWKTQTEYRGTNMHYEYLNPIEVTPEILTQNGFVFNHTYWHFVKDVNPELRYDVIYRMEDSWIHAASQNYRAGKNLHTCMTTAKYLHQFQNALWAAHINKEVQYETII